MKRIIAVLLILFVAAVVPHARSASNPVSSFDGITADGILYGWAYDPDASSVSIDVHIYINAPAGSAGAIGIGSFKADVSRPDINATFNITGNHAFYYRIPEPYRSQSHTYYLHAIDTNGGVNVVIPGSPKLFAPPYNTSVALNSFGFGTLNVGMTYHQSKIGWPSPNYEYSGHMLYTGGNPPYRIWYGARCFYDSSKNCQIPVNGSYTGSNPYGGDGDHVLLATSSDGTNWTTSKTPVIRPGRFEGQNANNYGWNNGLDPTMVQWNGAYYMIYQVEIESYDSLRKLDRSALCPKPSDPTKVRQCDRFLIARSTDLTTWTKNDSPIIDNLPKESMVYWPKAVVVDGQIWLYFMYFPSAVTGNYQADGTYLIKSTDIAHFDFNNRIKVNGDASNGQHAVLWPNDPAKRMHVVMTTNWSASNQGAHIMVPTLSFSKDGVNWKFSDTNAPMAFPQQFSSEANVFCGIGTQVNGGVPMNGNNPQAMYVCASFDGTNGEAGKADLIGGTLTFAQASAAPTATPTPTQVPQPTATPTTKPCSKSLGDANCDGLINLTDFERFRQEYTGLLTTKTSDFTGDGKVTLIDFETWRRNFK